MTSSRSVLFLLACLLPAAGCVQPYDDFSSSAKDGRDSPHDLRRADGRLLDRPADSEPDGRSVDDLDLKQDAEVGGQPSCGNGECKTGENCSNCPKDCGCAGGQTCYQIECCTPDCGGKECGDNGCGNDCGPCAEGFSCSNDKCLDGCENECSAGGKRCYGAGFQICGQHDEDVCLDWGQVTPCTGNDECQEGACLCSPQCAGKNCGNDGCGGTCGTCPEGSDCTPDGLCTDDGVVTIDELTPDELEKIAILRTAIDLGLNVGRFHYVEEVSIALQMKGLVDDYEQQVSDGFVGLEQAPEPCPFAKYYDNGFQATGDTCDYLADMAKVEVYSELSNFVSQNDLPLEVKESPHYVEAFFWYEQGAVSGVEEERVKVRFDMQQKSLCDSEPSALEASFNKGVLVGRQLFAEKFNDALAQNGYEADYPVMSEPILVCNADQNMLVPAKSKAIQSVELKAQQLPLCEDYVPPTEEDIQQYALAEADYAKGIKKGVDDEFGIAAVRLFEVVLCSVSDPIVIDLDGDGIELLPLHRGVNFDLAGSGEATAVAWISADDGFLILDRNGNGVVDDGSEMFGHLTAASAGGFRDLALLDGPAWGGNFDGLITSRDDAFALLGIWRDANLDGISAAQEVQPLRFYGVTSLDTRPWDARLRVAGNRVSMLSYAATTHGRRLVGEAALRSAPYARLSEECR